MTTSTTPRATAAKDATAEPKTIFELWPEVMADVQAIRKGDRNQAQGFNFRGIDAVVNAVGPALRKHGVFVVPDEILDCTYRDVTVGQKGTPMRECTIRVRWRAYGPRGDSFPFESQGEALDSGDKGTPKAQSVAYRVALLNGLTVPTDEQEPDSVSYERTHAQPAEPPAPNPVTALKREVLQAHRAAGLGSDPQTIGESFERMTGMKWAEAKDDVEALKVFVGALRDDAATKNGHPAVAS